MQQLQRLGYDSDAEQLRDAHFSRLVSNGTIYLDTAGAALPSEQLLKAVFQDLSTSLYANPHSQGPVSSGTFERVQLVREMVLRFFKVSHKTHSVIFTSGATSALKLVGEHFPWSAEATFIHSVTNHTSVVGITSYAKDKGASTSCLSLEEIKELSNSDTAFAASPTLIAVPAECNFSGVKPDLTFIPKLRAKGASILLDAAKFVATSQLDLNEVEADFVALSFYKIFGYPTGLGALIVRKESEALLQKKYFGGGTVTAAVRDGSFVSFRDSLSERFEDGSISFLSIASLQHAFQLQHLSMDIVQKNTFALSEYLCGELTQLKHYNGRPVCEIYGRVYPSNSKAQGPVVTFNMKRASGETVGHKEVEKLAAVHNIQIRTGCFCNPGACQQYLGLTDEDIRSNHASGHRCWDDTDIINGKPTGAIRISFGTVNVATDVEVWLKFIKRYFVTAAPAAEIRLPSVPNDKPVITSLYLYPIKSCAAMSVQAWPVGPHGLLYDREWSVVDDTGAALQQKREPKLCLIRPELDIDKGVLYIDAPSMSRLTVSLTEELDDNNITAVRVCGDRCQGKAYGAKVSEWLTSFLGRPCSLVRKLSNHMRLARSRVAGVANSSKASLSFSNEAHFLVISQASFEDLKCQMLQSASFSFSPCGGSSCSSKISGNCMHDPDEIQMHDFRPNVVVNGCQPYAEDTWKRIDVDGLNLQSFGPCSRCQMVNIRQLSAKQDLEPLRTLTTYRRVKAQILFGHLFTITATDLKSSSESWQLTVGAPIDVVETQAPIIQEVVVSPHPNQSESIDSF
eukprot:GILK01011657.1.p1 GENE.GILK01011657.1~~GILK01011657.1.p1  ORF type:complete len:796 (-),score=72.62 GILK01011657.1:42-2429(-)